ncbi:hypothetical protein CDD83_10563 [Cordyceps sp. RAO-2017]|nr:hypothetical protein CDD83_10563 [Cordyceps sp. RAO-2017]
MATRRTGTTRGSGGLGGDDEAWDGARGGLSFETEIGNPAAGSRALGPEMADPERQQSLELSQTIRRNLVRYSRLVPPAHEHALPLPAALPPAASRLAVPGLRLGGRSNDDSSTASTPTHLLSLLAALLSSPPFASSSPCQPDRSFIMLAAGQGNDRLM